MAQFYNPYNFIPVENTDEQDAQTPAYNYDRIAAGQSHVRHDSWQRETFSGRIICGIELLSPTLVGNEHRGGCSDPGQKRETEVEAYKVRGALAFPSTSLRGMISNVSETLSASALRVLTDSHYSVRAPMKKALSAIGLVREKLDGSGMELLPLTLPTMHLNKKLFPHWEQWRQIFSGQNLGHCLPVYVGDKGRGFSALSQLDTFQEKENEQYCYMRLSPTLCNVGIPTTVAGVAQYPDVAAPYIERKDNKKNTLVAQVLGGQSEVLTEEKWSRLPEQVKNEYTRGVMMILSEQGAAHSDMPKSKKHEKFIPLPKGRLDELVVIPVSEVALTRYQRIAEYHALSQSEKNQRDTPTLPKGYNKANTQDSTGQPVRKIRAGDLVYFDIANGEVSSISYSAIWRQEIQGSTWDYFREAGGKNSLPWSSERQYLTVAEAMYGVVAGRGKSDNQDRNSKNLAGRVCFSDARGENLKQDSEVIFKKLSSPKVPSPSMYFRNEKNTFIKVAQRSQMREGQYAPRGRKYYLPHGEKQDGHSLERATWATALVGEKFEESRDQHMRGMPLSAKQILYFDVSFENLSSAELGLLILSLKPSDEFIHRLGAGKPLGLGQVEIHPLSVHFIERSDRYSLDGIYNSRYISSWKNSQVDWSDALVTRYPEEHQSLSRAVELTVDTSLVRKASHIALCRLASRKSLKPGIPVCYPYRSDVQEPGSEEKGFQWYVKNDHENTHDASRQTLPAIDSRGSYPFPDIFHFESQADECVTAAWLEPMMAHNGQEESSQQRSASHSSYQGRSQRSQRLVRVPIYSVGIYYLGKNLTNAECKYWQNEFRKAYGAGFKIHSLRVFAKYGTLWVRMVKDEAERFLTTYNKIELSGRSYPVKPGEEFKSDKKH